MCRAHLVLWDQICKPKKEGGLGIRKVRLMNEALLVKVAFKMLVEKDSFWVEVIRNKYNCGDDILPIVTTHKNSSNLWKGIIKVWNKIIEFVDIRNKPELLRRNQLMAPSQ